jgi:hypothetical protein
MQILTSRIIERIRQADLVTACFGKALVHYPILRIAIDAETAVVGHLPRRNNARQRAASLLVRTPD